MSRVCRDGATTHARAATPSASSLSSMVVTSCVSMRVCAVDGWSVGRPFGWSSVALEDVLHIICQLLEPIYNQTLGMFTHSCTPHTHAYSEADICANHVPMSGRVRRARTEKDIIGHMHLVG